MSYNDRLREASVWVAAHPGETITVSVPKADLAEALWDAADDCRWPPALCPWHVRGEGEPHRPRSPRPTHRASRMTHQILTERQAAITAKHTPDALGCPESDEQAVRAHGDGSGPARPAERQL